MKKRLLSTVIILASLTASQALPQAQDEPKKKSWFRRIFQRSEESPSPERQTVPKDTSVKPKSEPRKPAATDDRKRETKERAEGKTHDNKWTEQERRALEEYLKRKNKDREDDDDDRGDYEDHGGGKNKKDKKNKGGGKGRGKGPGWKNQGGLPPGLQKKLDRGGELPPGWQKKLAAGQVMEKTVYEQAAPLPKNVFMTLPPQPHDTEIVTIEDKVVRVMKDTRQILDVFGLGDVLSGKPKPPTTNK